jgi:hypothetical protein
MALALLRVRAIRKKCLMQKLLTLIVMLALVSTVGTGCFIFRKSEKRGCPSNGKNVGAERILSGEKKLPKAKKFNS